MWLKEFAEGFHYSSHLNPQAQPPACMWLKAFVNKESPLKGNPLKLSCSHFLLHWTIHAAMVLLSTDIQTLWSYPGDKL